MPVIVSVKYKYYCSRVQAAPVQTGRCRTGILLLPAYLPFFSSFLRTALCFLLLPFPSATLCYRLPVTGYVVTDTVTVTATATTTSCAFVDGWIGRLVGVNDSEWKESIHMRRLKLKWSEVKWSEVKWIETSLIVSTTALTTRFGWSVGWVVVRWCWWIGSEVNPH